MAKSPKEKIEDEPGAQERFMRGIRKALKTPHKPHKSRAGRGKTSQSGKKKGSPK